MFVLTMRYSAHSSSFVNVSTPILLGRIPPKIPSNFGHHMSFSTDGTDDNGIDDDYPGLDEEGKKFTREMLSEDRSPSIKDTSQNNPTVTDTPKDSDHLGDPVDDNYASDMTSKLQQELNPRKDKSPHYSSKNLEKRFVINYNLADSIEKGKKSEFIVHKFNSTFKGFKIQSVDEVMNLVQSSTLVAKEYAKWMTEWQVVADQPLYLKSHMSPEEYNDVKSILRDLSQLNRTHAEKINRISRVFKSEMAKAEAFYSNNINRIKGSNEVAWLLTLTERDLPLTVTKFIQDNHPNVSRTYKNEDGILITRPSDELTAMKTQRTVDINKILGSYRMYLLDQRSTTNMSLRKIHESLLIDPNFQPFVLN